MFDLPKLQPEEIIMYLRKSRTDDPSLTVEETVSKHEHMLDEWCKDHLSDLIPERNRFREIVSGETIAARPEMQKVLRLIEQPCYRAIIIVEPQRLSRGDLEDIGRLSKLLRYTGTIIITLQYNFDLTDERDRDYFERELKKGNEYLEYSKRILMNGRNLAAEKGYYTCSREPYGYKRIFKKEGSRKYPTLEIVPYEADIIRLIFQLYIDGNGATKICSKLNAIGCKPKQSSIWTPPCIYSMLDNPLYNGKIKWGYRKTVKTVENGEITLHNPINKECPVYEGKHEAIINDEMWYAVRKRRDAHEIPRVPVSKKLLNPLSGLLYCACGRMMIRRPYSGRCEDRFQCPNQTYCNNASCTVNEMMEAVTGVMCDAISDFEVRISSEQPENERTDYVMTLYARLSDLEKKEAALWEKYAEGMPANIFDSLISKNAKQKEDVSAMIAEAESSASKTNYADLAKTFSDTIAAIRSDDVPIEETNAMLKVCIKRITYSRERGTRGKGGWKVNPMCLDFDLNI